MSLGIREPHSVRRQRIGWRGLMSDTLLRLLADQLTSCKGRAFRSPTVDVTPQMLEHFEQGTLLHRAYVDDPEPGYPDHLVPGFLTLSLIDALSAMTPELRLNGAYALNYGLDRVRFVTSLYLGDEVQAVFETHSFDRRGDGFLVRRSATVERTSDGVITAVVDSLLLALPSHPSANGSEKGKVD